MASYPINDTTYFDIILYSPKYWQPFHRSSGSRSYQWEYFIFHYEKLSTISSNYLQVLQNRTKINLRFIININVYNFIKLNVKEKRKKKKNWKSFNFFRFLLLVLFIWNERSFLYININWSRRKMKIKLKWSTKYYLVYK